MDNSKNISDSAYSELMSEKSRKLTDDIQLIMARFHVACKDGRTTDVRVLMDNVLQLLQELKDELSKSSQTSPLQADSFELFSEDIRRILQLESDDATSTLADLANLKPEPAFQSHQPADFVAVQEQQSGCQGFYDYSGSTSTMHNEVVHDSELASQLDYLLDFNQDLGDFTFNESNDVKQFEHNVLLPCISPPPSAFLGPICALWDCQRPAQTQNAEWCQDYCSSMHADLAFNEGGSGKGPILRPGGIGLKDDRLFSTLIAKVNGKYVGIPECEGAAIEKSPWNASKLFDLALLEGETLREWLFFDKPRRAFESGNRKQRSLSDYNGRGWHESRKQLMKELGGHKRSYYMDPQPPGPFEWHLFEYVMNNSDVCALYKLELKFVTEKKSPKGGKVMNDSLVDLQKKMGMLTAEGSPDSKPLKGRTKASKGTDSESTKLN